MGLAFCLHVCASVAGAQGVEYAMDAFKAAARNEKVVNRTMCEGQSAKQRATRLEHKKAIDDPSEEAAQRAAQKHVSETRQTRSPNVFRGRFFDTKSMMVRPLCERREQSKDGENILENSTIADTNLQRVVMGAK